MSEKNARKTERERVKNKSKERSAHTKGEQTKQLKAKSVTNTEIPKYRSESHSAL